MHPIRLVLVCAGLFAGLLPSGSAHAQNCWSAGSSGLDFGTVNASAHTDVQATANLSCQGAAAEVIYVRYCVTVNEGSPIGGVAPRWMTNNNGAQMAYNVYSDPARTQVIGPPPSGAGYAPYGGTLVIPVNAGAQVNVPIYGRVPSGQVLPATQPFQAQVYNSTIRWAAKAGDYPVSCDAGGSITDSEQFYMNVKATYSNSCTIGISGTTDLDFGSTASLGSARDNSSTITLSCPSNTSWRVGLNDGTHALATQRRMAGAVGEYVQYELYRDSARTQRWGNDVAGGMNGSGASQANPTVLTVHGRVPAQAAVAPGSYSDTVTVTLTY